MRSMFGLLLASAILAFRSSAIAAPGDPFGGDDAGCIPPTAAVGRCEDGVQKALTKYIQTVIKCHIKAADAAVNSMPFDEELCESDPSTAKGAKERYDAAIAKLALTCSGQCAVLNAPGLRATVETLLDDGNGAIYGCPGAPFGGDDAGNVPTDPLTAKCEDGVAKANTKYIQAVTKCHIKAADAGVKGKPFDEELCESDPVGGKGAKEKYDAAIAKLALSCPACSTANASALRAATEVSIECHNGDIYCDGTTPSACAANCPTNTSTTMSPTTTTTTTSTSTTTSTTLPVCFQDLADGTILDTCTNLQWEKKTTPVDSGVNAADLHDVDNRYSWAGQCTVYPNNLCQPNLAAETACKAQTHSAPWSCEQCPSYLGTCDVYGAITTVWDWLTQVNAESFAGHSDWRLATTAGCCGWETGDLEELGSIRDLGQGICGGGSGACIDPIFGPTAAADYYSASTAGNDGNAAGIVPFDSGGLGIGGKMYGMRVRAVR